MSEEFTQNAPSTGLQQPQTINPQSGNNQTSQYLSPGSSTSLSSPGSASDLLINSSNVGINLNNVTPSTLQNEFVTTQPSNNSSPSAIVGVFALIVIVVVGIYLLTQRKA